MRRYRLGELFTKRAEHLRTPPEGESFTVQPTACYRRNIAALVASQSDVATAIREVSIPDSVEPATGRDGSATFLLDLTDGVHWFGRSSMPSVSATELFGVYQSDGRSVLLPGILTGLEPLVITGCMPPHAALFVVESDALHLKLAMHLYDYAALFQTGRLVFLLCSAKQLPDRMREFFGENPGYELPAHLLTASQCSPAQANTLRIKLEEVAEVITAAHAAQVSAHTETLKGRTFELISSNPRVAVISVDPRDRAVAQAHRVCNALQSLGISHTQCVPELPRKCHTVARTDAIIRGDADLVIFIGEIPEVMRAVIPPELPLACWSVPDDPSLAGNLSAYEGAVLAVGGAVFDAMRDDGSNPATLYRCEPSADTTVFQPSLGSVEENQRGRVDVAILGNVQDDRPESHGVQFASQLSIWKSMQHVVKGCIDSFRAEHAGALLDEAQQHCGTTLGDEPSRAQFVLAITTHIAPAASARAIAEGIVGRGRSIGAWGQCWSALADGSDIRRGLIPSGEKLNEVFSEARVVVIAEPSAFGVQLALDALAAGALVALRATAKQFRTTYPGLSDLLPYLHLYTTPRELIAWVGQLDAEAARWAIQSRNVRALVEADHSVGRRVRGLVDAVRSARHATMRAS